MRTQTSTELADYLAGQMAALGSISRGQAERILFRRGGFLAPEQVAQALIVAVCRGQIVSERGGTTLSAPKRVQS